MKSFKISVTEADIAIGQRRNTRCCPIALAVRRQFDVNFSAVCVGCDKVHVGRRNFRMSGSARQFIMDFDRAKPVAPAMFELEEES